MKMTFDFNKTSAIMQADILEGGDAPASTATPYSVDIGDTFYGTIETEYAHDWVAVDLVAGEDYVFWVRGINGVYNGLYDTTLAVHNSAGTQVAFNDDLFYEDSIYFSLIEFTAGSTGTYYLNIGGYEDASGGVTGDYALEVSTSTFTTEEVATFLTEYSWGYPSPLRFDVSPGDTLTYSIARLTPEGRQLAEWALETWSIALGINFQIVNAYSADIMFDDSEPGAFAGPNDINLATGINGSSSVNVSTDWLDTYGTTIDSYSFQTYLHEIGHALGLGHAGPYDGSATFGDDNVYLNDSVMMTLMSYFQVSENPNIDGDDVFLTSLMPADLVAIQMLYGPAEVYGGDTVWGANSNVGGWLEELFDELFHGVDSAIYAGGEIGFTIYDTGGTDTFDLSTVTTALDISLTPGSVLSFGGLENNVIIDSGAVIENLIGGSADDMLSGNDALNQIIGGAGNDTIIGFNGADTLLGGEGNDSIRGGAKGDLVEGQTGDDLLFGGFGDDTLSGAQGRDKLRGHDGDDDLLGGNKIDTLIGGDGEDYLSGGTGNDRLNGGGDNDTLVGGDGDDRLLGHAGDDLLTGGLGADRFRFLIKDGEIGDDTITDFELGIDNLRLDEDLWGGGLTRSDVVTQFASVIDGDVVFDFGDGDRITLEGLTSTAGLVDDISLI